MKKTGDTIRKKQIRNSVLLAAVLFAVVPILYMIRGASSKASSKQSLVDENSQKAVIQIDGKKVHTMDLDQDAEYKAKTDDGHYNVVVVKDQSVMVSEADCRNQICVKTKPVRNPGEVIACMPHRLIVYIESGNAE